MPGYLVPCVVVGQHGLSISAAVGQRSRWPTQPADHAISASRSSACKGTGRPVPSVSTYVVVTSQHDRASTEIPNSMRKLVRPTFVHQARTCTVSPPLAPDTQVSDDDFNRTCSARVSSPRSRQNSDIASSHHNK